MMSVPFLLQRLATEQDKKKLLEYISKIEQCLRKEITVEDLFEYHFDTTKKYKSISELLRGNDLLKNPFELLETYLDLYYSDPEVRDSSPYFNGEREVMLSARHFLSALEVMDMILENEEKSKVSKN